MDEMICSNGLDESAVLKMDEMILENWYQGEMVVSDTDKLVPGS